MWESNHIYTLEWLNISASVIEIKDKYFFFWISIFNSSMILNLVRIIFGAIKKMYIYRFYNSEVRSVGLGCTGPSSCNLCYNKSLHSTPVFIAALFTIARTRRQPRCLSADEWIRKLWYIYTMEYYSAVKKNAFESVLMR